MRKVKTTKNSLLNSISLICPICESNLTWPKENQFAAGPQCQFCVGKFSIENSILHPNNSFAESDDLYNFKNFVKRFPKIFLYLGSILGPLLPTFQLDVYAALKKIRKSQEILGINLGSGTSNFGNDILNIDFYQYKNVDLVADISRLPLAANQFDVVVLTEVIEHVPDPIQIIREATRVLKKDGFLLITAPFMVGFHGSPNDFQRFTLPGLDILLMDFRIIERKKKNS